MKPLGKVKIEWSPTFAYAIGLLVSDGNLSPNGRTINFTSKDLELVETFRGCLGVDNKIAMKASGITAEKKYFCVQVGDILFYRFLLEIGLMPNKSKIIGRVEVPDEYFFDFLRGCFDGDGYSYSYWDPRWRSSFMFYTGFVSASPVHVEWLRFSIKRLLGIRGHTTKSVKNSAYQLKYAKAESLILLPKLYYNPSVVCLSRKRAKVEKALGVEGRQL